MSVGYSNSNFGPNWIKQLPLVGRGTVIFNLERWTPFTIVIRPAKAGLKNTEWIALNVRKDSAEFQLGKDVQSPSGGVLEPRATGSTPWNVNEKVGFVKGRKVAYWFSFDRDRLIVKYGKGYIMTESTLLTHDFLKGKNKTEEEDMRKKMSYLFAPEVEKVIELYDVLPLDGLAEAYALDSLTNVSFSLSSVVSFNDTQATPAQLLQSNLTSKYKATLSTRAGKKALLAAKCLVDVEKEVDLYPLPLTVNLPKFVLDSSKLTLFDLDKNNRMFSASLPSACQTLYGNVTGELVDLDWPWPHGGVNQRFSDAIRYSIKTPGKILFKKLEEKQNEFGPGKKTETYLRVTLGEYRGDSPGIPYVLEIWPSNHGSPIHNHGNAFCVIKVLFGGLTISVFNKHPVEQDKCLSKFDVKKGDVTWISPNWYQTHKLWNHTDDFCATVQCYQYGKDDELAWPYFDYLAHTTVIDEFIPNSDFTFTDLHDKLMVEYDSAPKKF